MLSALCGVRLYRAACGLSLAGQCQPHVDRNSWDGYRRTNANRDLHALPHAISDAGANGHPAATANRHPAATTDRHPGTIANGYSAATTDRHPAATANGYPAATTDRYATT